MTGRRDFLKTSTVTTAGLFITKPLHSIAGITNHSFFKSRFQLNTIPVFHTTDLKDIHNYSGFGGISWYNRVNKINELLRSNNSHILLDAGNFLTPGSAINEKKDIIEIMNKMMYNVVAVDRSELSGGEDELASLLKSINFKLVNCNYEFSNTDLANRISACHVIKYGKFKIGVTAVGRRVTIAGVKYHNPYRKANETADYLKKQLNCDLVICLSSLPHKEQNNPDNCRLAVNSENIDLIIGRLDKNLYSQIVLHNKLKNEVIISNSGVGGSTVGKVAFTLDDNRNKHLFHCENYTPGFTGNDFNSEYKKLIA